MFGSFRSAHAIDAASTVRGRVGGLSPRRSDAAERHDPPLVVRRFVTERALSRGELLAEVAERLAGTSAVAERAYWHGGVHVNGHPLDPDAPPAPAAAGSWVIVYAFEREPEPVAAPLRVLHDGDGLVAVAKPPWLPMQRSRASARFTLEAALRERLGDPTLVAAHRLDRQTSGVAVFARGRAGAWASAALGARRAKKRYLAVVAPPPAEERFAVSGWIARVPDPARFRFALAAASSPGARDSASAFRVLERRGARALVEAIPETGRTHQLRIHLAAHGSPIVGDDLYGPPYAEGAVSSAERVLLHAAALELLRPDDTTLQIACEPPADLAL